MVVVTDVRDVVAGTILTLESDNAIGEAFNMTGLSTSHLRPVPRALIADRDRTAPIGK